MHLQFCFFNLFCNLRFDVFNNGTFDINTLKTIFSVTKIAGLCAINFLYFIFYNLNEMKKVGNITSKDLLLPRLVFVLEQNKFFLNYLKFHIKK